MSRLIVTVDGIDGSGKSIFADRLAAGLAREGLAPCVLRIDDFRQALDWSAGDEAQLYYDGYFDLAAVADAAGRFAAGDLTLTTPSFDGVAGAPGPHRTATVGPRAALVVEGVFVRRIDWPDPAWHFYLDVPFDTGRSRVMARDMARGREAGEVDRRWRMRYRPAQERYIRQTQPAPGAALVIDNTRPDTPRLIRGDLSPLPVPLARAVRALLPA